MKITQIFGTHLRPTHEYVGWLETKEGQSLIADSVYRQVDKWTPTAHAVHSFDLVMKAHTFLSQPNQLSDFVNPHEKPSPYLKMNEGGSHWYNQELERYENWQPIYKGEWEVNDHGDLGLYVNIKGQTSCIDLSECKTRNDFATHCMNLGFLPELNEEYELN